MKRLLLLCLLILPLALSAAKDTENVPDGIKRTVPEMIRLVKERIKRFQWDLSLFSEVGWQFKDYTVNGMPSIYWTCGDADAANRALILSNVHGDEVTPVYFGFRLVEYLKSKPELCSGKFVVIAPIVNPDGFLRYTNGTRSNYNKVDLNRNFDTPDWNREALKQWKTKFASQRRYYPGPQAASEPETRFQMWLIDEFKPTKIISIHAPLNILDYDGPQDQDIKKFTRDYIDSCEALKEAMHKAAPLLRSFAYGYFPGSLGNYAGHQRGIPTLTTELPTSKPELAASYFGQLEKSTLLFLDYQVTKSASDKPR